MPGLPEHAPPAPRNHRTYVRPTGRIDSKLIQEAAHDLADPIYYVSGTPSMVVGMLRLLRGLDVPDASIEVEAFRGYE